MFCVARAVSICSLCYIAGEGIDEFLNHERAECEGYTPANIEQPTISTEGKTFDLLLGNGVGIPGSAKVRLVFLECNI